MIWLWVCQKDRFGLMGEVQPANTTTFIKIPDRTSDGYSFSSDKIG